MIDGNQQEADFSHILGIHLITVRPAQAIQRAVVRSVIFAFKW